MGGLTKAQIEKLRNVGLEIRADGSLWHQGEPVRHNRLRTSLLRWLDVVDDRDVVRIDEQRFAYVDVHDAHLLVLSARVEDSKVTLTLNSGESEEMNIDTATLRSDGAIEVRVRGGKLRAKFTPSAQRSLEPLLTEQAGLLGLALGGLFRPLEG